MMSFFKKMFQWMLPHTCLLCRTTADQAEDICRACFADLPFYPNGCQYCARIIPHSTTKLICGLCLQNPPPFDRTFSLFAYHPPVTKIILDLKFQNALGNALLLGTWMTAHIRQTWYRDSPLPDAIIPVPLNRIRLRERGFNQALEIAKPIHKMLGIPLLTDVCERTKPTLPQATLAANLRQKNVKNAFQIKKDFAEKYRHIAVLDDVITTGGTITEFCHTLKKHGVEKIDVWCCARPSQPLRKSVK